MGCFPFVTAYMLRSMEWREREREMNLERTEISGWRDGRTEIVGVPQLKRGKKLSNPHDILRRQHPPDFGFIIKVKVRLLIGVLLQ